ncbi:hypothetical protein [Amycolatopsis taiwanensis]|uniref:Potassium channel domain-containing protein n=1 Tax=Amycolatopsis taiwanensis TaxID=342230 RepID=A0A9W6R7X5_9PSEU|nr:hypothetical protein [Amycolatopsis taiwanensis]GLY70468.1 hypothetical protein Atai01_70870 [Amycolatopsis taiwanensis]
MSALSPEPPDYVESTIIRVTRRADRYLEYVNDVLRRNALRAEEGALLDRFERETAVVLDRYHPPSTRLPNNLVFAQLYDDQRDALPDERRRATIAALMAAEVESRGPLRQTQAQNAQLAELFKRVGTACEADGLLLHAELAFERAADIYLLLNQHVKRDHCLFAKERCRHHAAKPGWGRAMAAISSALCGYGYQPYRLLLWVLAQLLVFCVAIALVARQPVSDSIYTSFANYLNPLGTGDTATWPGAARVLLVIESYTGYLSLSVFFALLVRRWFRT